MEARQRYEAWAKRRYNLNLVMTPKGDYAFSPASVGWEAWQEAIKESSKAVAEVSASHQKDTNGECKEDCDFVAVWDTAIKVIEELGK